MNGYTEMQKRYSSSLKGQVALVTGASRGIGRGIAVELGRAGATVYITAIDHSREDETVQSVSHLLPTLKDVAEEIEAAGGQAIPIECDHGHSEQVRSLFDCIASEQNGRLDIVVSNAFDGVTTMMKTKSEKFFNLPDNVFDRLNNVGLRGHYLCLKYAAKLMVPRRRGLIVTTSSPGGIPYVMGVAYGIGKAGCDKMASDAAVELFEFNVASVSLWLPAVRSELITDCGLGVDQIEYCGAKMPIKDLFQDAQSIYFGGHCVVALVNDTKIMKKSGMILTDMDLSKQYGLYDIDGRRPWCPITAKYMAAVNALNEARREGMQAVQKKNCRRTG